MKIGRKIPNSAALAIIEQAISRGSTVRLKVRGNSMMPTLADGVDEVRLKPFAPDGLKTGDVILFRHGEGFLMHRIVSIRGKGEAASIVTRGDALKTCEEAALSEVVALAELSEPGLIKKAVRRCRMILSKILRGLLALA